MNSKTEVFENLEYLGSGNSDRRSHRLTRTGSVQRSPNFVEIADFVNSKKNRKRIQLTKVKSQLELKALAAHSTIKYTGHYKPSSSKGENRNLKERKSKYKWTK